MSKIQNGCPRETGGSARVCVCVRVRGSVETPYLGIALPPLLGVLLVLL